MKTLTTKTLTELKDFVTHQAAEDAVLSVGERKHQEKLVADVLGQETPNSKILKELLNLYCTERQAA